MTWVIGRAGPFGYAVGLSDIRVTLQDGTERDCLQKLYRIGPQLAIGFAGSVFIGFEFVNQLSASLQPPEKDLVWNPRFIGESLPEGARKLFMSFPEYQRKLGCQLMLLGAHPTENDGAAPWARCYAYRYSAPEFEPELARPAQIVSIGSGSSVKPYVEALRRLEDDFQLFQLHIGHPDGAAMGLMVSISSELKKLPIRGISDHLHICIVGRDNIRIGKNNISIPDNPEENFQMPPVATSFEELKSILSDQSTSMVEQARC